MKRRIIIVILGVGFLAGVLSFKPDNHYFEIAKNLDIFATLFKEVNTYYVDEVDPEELINSGIDAMLSSLDPYTNYIPEDARDEYRTMTTGEYAGIGSLIASINGKVVITMPNAGFPADRAGLKIGDEILSIDGVDVRGENTGRVSKLLKGKANTTVNIQVRRFGTSEPMNFEIKRSRIVINNVPYYGMVTDDIGYIKLSDFTTNAGRETKEALLRLKSRGAEGIILDLRGNPGGLLHEAVNVCNLFLGKGKTVVSTHGKVKDWNSTYKTLNDPVDERIPIVILTNTESASASEIVSGVIQDYDRGVIVGRRTYGKGLVQTTRPLAYNTQLKVTTAKYYTPSGRCIQAIDYQNGNGDGRNGKIPDSLKVAFQTSKGRTVYDGGGVDPDVKIEHNFLAPITFSLLQEGLIFEYATQYNYTVPNIAQPKDFELTDSEYDTFTKWLGSKEYEYTTPIEHSMTQLFTNAQKESYFDEIKAQIEELQGRILHNKESDLVAYREQIRGLLEEQIASRYYLETGEIEASFDKDQDLQEAIRVLNDRSRYRKILNPN